jgi:hypothetical protein
MHDVIYPDTIKYFKHLKIVAFRDVAPCSLTHRVLEVHGSNLAGSSAILTEAFVVFDENVGKFLRLGHDRFL